MSDRDRLAAALKSVGDATSLSLHSSRWWGEMADALLAEGVRMPGRVITTEEQLTALSAGTVIRWGGVVYQHIGSGWWITPGTDHHSHSESIIDVVNGDEITVLWSPTEKAGQ